MTDPRPKNFKEKFKELRRFDPLMFAVETTQRTTAVDEERSTSTGLTEYAGELEERQIAHLLKRTLFGVKNEELSQFMGQSLSEAVSSLLSPESTFNAPVNNYYEITQYIDDYEAEEDVGVGEDWSEAKEYWPISFLRLISLKGRWIKNILEQEPTIHQKMIVFWHTLIPTQFFDIGISKLSFQYFKKLHQHALGNFKTIIKEMTLDPSMLIYLNGFLNSKYAPDENYARELQELFTIGKGPDSKFTEDDVYEAARVLTGWRIDWETIDQQEGPAEYYFEPLDHDTEDKQFSSFYNDRTIAGKSESDGSLETDELIDMLFDNEETALYICRRLYNFFVYHEIDENAEVNVIQPLAQLFRDSDYEIAPVLEALFKSDHFFEESNIGAYIKSPADHFLSMLRVLNGRIPEDLSMQYQMLETYYWLAGNLGMELGDPPNVAGWQAYYQQPTYDKIWINTDTTTRRAEYQDWTIYDLADLPTFIDTLNDPSDPNELIRETVLLLHGIEVEQEVLDDLKANLLAGQQTDNYWTNAWLQYKNDPDNEEYRSIVVNRLRALYRPLLQLSEFQLF